MTAARGKGTALALGITPGALAPGALESLRALGELGARLGGEYALAGKIIAARLEAIPCARLARRDAALVALAQTYVGRLWTVAGSVSTELQRYAASAWKRRDRNLASAPSASAPSEYLTQPRKLAAFEAMRADDTVAGLGRKQISRILASHCYDTRSFGHSKAVSMSIASAQPLIRSNEDRPLNAISPIISDREFVDAIRRAPAGQAIIQAETARVIAERKKLVARLAALDAKAAVDLPKLDKAIQAEIAATRASEAELRAQNEKLRLAGLAKSGAAIAYDAERQRIEAELRATPAGKIIDEFLREMRDEIDVTMKKHEGGMFQELRPLARDPAERVLRHSFGNRASVSARLDAIHSATAEAERLRLAADQTDLAAKLEALRAGLPAVAGAFYPMVRGAAA
jgi:hypothetical protein